MDELLAAAGRKPSSLRRSMMTGTRFGSDEAKLKRRLADAGEEEGALRAHGVLVGTANQFAEQLGRLEEAGLQRVMLQWLDLDDIRQRYRDEWAQFFERYDILLCPVASTVPFPHDQAPREERHYRINGEDRPLGEYIMWPGLIGLAYLPSTSTPLGPAENGLPVGVQVVGPHLSDRRTIHFAGLMREVIGGYERPPGY